jgi:hypothetical protein
MPSILFTSRLSAQEACELLLGDSIGAVAGLPPREDEIAIAHDNVKV